VPEGLHTIQTRATDSAGNTAALPFLQPIKVDVTSPVPEALSPEPVIWLKLVSFLGNFLGFSPDKAKLNFKVSDNLSSQLEITAIVFDELGTPVREITKSVLNVTPGVTKNSFVYWDGRDQSLLGVLGVGIYHYRIIAIDEAGNPAQSGESKPLQIKLG
jgi:hypothetical protein